MILDSRYNTYLSVIQDESLKKLYEILPSLRPTHDYGSWDGWKEIKLTPSRTMGLFVSIENYDSPVLINDLGSLDIPDAVNAECSTKAWLLVEVVALCEALRTTANQEHVFPFTFALSERLKITEVLEGVSKTKFLRSESQRRAAVIKWTYQRQIKEVAGLLFEHFSLEKPISSSELMELLQSNEELWGACAQLGYDFNFKRGEGDSMVFAFSDGAEQKVSVKTIPNWRSDFVAARSK